MKNIAVIGSKVNITVNDEKLKIDIKDVDANDADCVKNAKIKTFEYKEKRGIKMGLLPNIYLSVYLKN